MTIRFSHSRPALTFSLFVSVLWGTAASAHERAFPEAKHGRGELRYVDGVPVAILQGSPEEIGAQHAALVLQPSARLLDFPKDFLAAEGQEELWPLAVQASNTLWKRSPQRYQRELAALVGSIQNHAASHAAEAVSVSNTLLELRSLGCSTLIVESSESVTGGPLFGRNLDLPSLGVLDRYSLVMVYRPTGYRAFAAVSFPCLVGLFSGINDAGLAVATLDVYESADQSPCFDGSGVPMALIYRQILEECATVDEAEQLLKRTQATTWTNLAVCDRDGGAVFEITPRTVARREADQGVLPCTNHFRSEGLAVDSHCWRYELLEKAAGATPLDVEAVHSHLHRANQGELTLQTMVFEPRELVLHLALGKPPSSRLPLKHLPLRQFFESEVPATAP